MTSACPNLEFLGTTRFTDTKQTEKNGMEIAARHFCMCRLRHAKHPDIDALHLQVRDGHLNWPRCCVRLAYPQDSTGETQALKFSAKTANQTVRT